MNMEWLWDNFPNDIRFHTMIFEADNVLDPKVIRAMYSVRKRVSEAVTDSGDTWEDMCQRVPIVRPPDITKGPYLNNVSTGGGNSKSRQKEGT